MRNIIKHLMPMNFYSIAGTICCKEMYDSYQNNNITNHFLCYHSKSIFESNIIIIWGDISPKLQNQIFSYLSYLPKYHALFHIIGCSKHQKPEIKDSILIPKCSLLKSDTFFIIKEARKCLIV